MSSLFIGTSGWSYKDWLGPFYPQGSKQKEYLSLYSQQFRNVEIDSTFYAIPRLSTVENWYKQTPENFRFCPKVAKQITHDKQLLDCDEDWNRFLDTMRALQFKLGPLVLQFDYKFRYDTHFKQLESFLKTHHKEERLCVEIRHRSWHNESFYKMLSNFNCALVLNDLYYMPRIVQLTTDFTYVRLLGNRKQIPDDFSHVRVNREQDFNWWTEWIHRFLQKNLDVYVYSNNRYQGHAPSTIRTLQQKLQS